MTGLILGAAKLRMKRFIHTSGLLVFVTNSCLRVLFADRFRSVLLPKRQTAIEQL